MNKLQETEFELLKLFDDICKKLNIEYFLVCGSALGAVKYNGFIPWDDDIDVGLYRKDYELFINRAKDYLPSDIFLQNYKTDLNFPHIYSKLRNSNTTYIENLSSELNINHGVFIDIFPLDGYPSNPTEIKRLEKEKSFVKLIQTSVFTYPKHFKKINIQKKFLRFLRIHKKLSEFVSRLDTKYASYDTDTSAIICNHGNSWSDIEYSPKNYYGNGYPAYFEGLKVKVPEKYDLYLTQKYGKWEEDLEEQQKKGHHLYTICDLDNPYSKYINKG